MKTYLSYLEKFHGNIIRAIVVNSILRTVTQRRFLRAASLKNDLFRDYLIFGYLDIPSAFYFFLVSMSIIIIM